MADDNTDAALPAITPDVEPAETKEAEAPAFPAHLKPEWFADGAPVPEWMAANPDWMNQANMQTGPIWVRFPDGSEHPTTNPIHLGRFILEAHAQIIPIPQED